MKREKFNYGRINNIDRKVLVTTILLNKGV